LLDNKYKKIIKKIKQQLPSNGKLIYLTFGGSHLFGLNTSSSDIDIKGLFLASTTDTTAFKPEHIDLSTNKSNTKNNSEDIDIELFNIHKFFKMINVGDTNTYDLLFSMFQQNTILLETKESNVLKENYRDFLSTNSKAFLGYVVAQTKKYGVKGERYNSLKNVYSHLLNYININNVDLQKDNISKYIKDLIFKNFNHVVLLDKTSKELRVGGGIYIEILNKEYHETIKFDYFLKRIKDRMAQYGMRSKSAAKGIDFKSLSHALRIIYSFEELMDTHFIEFPLKKRESILKIKKGDLSEFNNNYEEILLFLDKKVDFIEDFIENVGLPSKIKEGIFNKILIKIISQH